MALRHDARARARSRPRTHHYPGPRRRASAHRTAALPALAASPASRRCSPPPAHAGRCCLTPPPNPLRQVLLVEGEPDMIAARSRGLPAIAVPGVDGWRRAWARLLAGREVTVIMDCDEQGRAAAAAIASDLSSLGDVRVLDLAPDRNDGYDLTDWLLERQQSQVAWPSAKPSRAQVTRVMAAASPNLLTPEEAAVIARCSVKTVRRAYASGALTAYRRRGSRAVLLRRPGRAGVGRRAAFAADRSGHDAVNPRRVDRKLGSRPGGWTRRRAHPSSASQLRFDLSEDALRGRRSKTDLAR